MTTIAKEKVTGKFTFQRGIHPPHRKSFSEDAAVEDVNLSPGAKVVIPMSQHLGAPCKPLVEKGQQVQAGQEVGSADAFVSAPVHSPVQGVVKEVSAQPNGSGAKVLSVVIEAGPEQPAKKPWKDFATHFEIGNYDSPAILDAIRKAGLVGQGGAAFPTAVKLTQNPKKPVDTVIINGCECEPYLTSDHRLMVEAPKPMIAGLQLAMKAAGANRGIIAIEDNKPEAINTVLTDIKDIDNIQLAICHTKYPQGGERQLIQAILNRVVPTGGLPLDVGVVVVNAGTASAIAWACVEGRALTERIVTVTGAGVKKPGNYRVPIGMMLSDLLAVAGGLPDDAEKVLLGGPMMGPTASRLDVPIVKGTSGLTVLVKKDITEVETMACIRCKRCVDHCPIGLVPTRIAHAVKARDLAMALEYDLMACIECGCCSYICPSNIPLVQYLRAGKQMAREAAQKK